MKKLLLKTGLFLGASSLIYIVSVIIIGEFAPSMFKKNISYKIGAYGHLNTRLKEAKNTSNIDILFLGSSHSYRGFDPRIFKEHGFTSFNLGSSSQSHLQTELLLDRHLQKLNPKTVIYEVYPNVFTVDGVESTLDIISNEPNDLGSVLMALETFNIKVYNTLILSIYKNYTGYYDSFKEPKIKAEDTYINGGFVEKEIQFNSPSIKQSKQLTISPIQLKAFQRNLEKLKQQHVDVILVQAPINKNTYQSWENIEEFTEIMNSQKLPYYDFNKTIKLDDSLHFSDHHHLNQVGVKLFNKDLISTLNRDNHFDQMLAKDSDTE